MSGFVDLHCHILHGVDDGPETVDLAVEMVIGLEDLGFTDFYPTPHQKPGSWMPTSEQTLTAAEELRTALDAAGSAVTVHDPAGENMWGERLLEGGTDSFPTYPGGKAFLMEFTPFAVPAQVRRRFYEFRRAGALPVIAHVERYPEITTNEERLLGFAASAAMLVNISSLAGWWSSRETRRLVRQGWVSAAASDAHGPDYVERTRRGIDWIRSKLGEDALTRLLCDNPRQILSGEIPEPQGE